MPTAAAAAIDAAASAPPAPTPQQHQQQQQHKAHVMAPTTQQQQQQEEHRATAAAAEDAATAAAAAAALMQKYSQMAAAFAQQGLDTAAVAAAAAWFDVSTPEGDPQPLFYVDPAFPPNPLPPAAVRLLLVPLAAQDGGGVGDSRGAAMAEACRPLPEAAAAAAAAAAGSSCSSSSQAVLAAAAQVVREVQQLLPPGCQVFANPPSALHITLFHFSHPLDTRPDTLLASSAQQGGVLSLPPSLRPGPTPAQLAAEQATTAAVVAAAQPLVLQLERVVVTRSGTLLLLWLDVDGGVARLRGALSATFPGGSSRQADIVHTSLLRIVRQQERDGTAQGTGHSGQQQQQQPQLPPDAVRALSSVCEALSTQLRGLRLRVSRLQWVIEEQFSTVAGEATPMVLGA